MNCGQSSRSSMSAGLNFQYLVGSVSRASRRAFCSPGEMCSMTLSTVVPSAVSSLLEVDDLAVARLDHLGRREVPHPVHDHVLVVRAVEDAQHAGGGQLLADAPEEVVRLLLVGRRLELGDVHAVRIRPTRRRGRRCRPCPRCPSPAARAGCGGDLPRGRWRRASPAARRAARHPRRATSRPPSCPHRNRAWMRGPPSRGRRRPRRAAAARCLGRDSSRHASAAAAPRSAPVRGTA